MRHQKQIILHRFIRCQVNLPAGQPVFKPVYNGNRMKLQKDLFIFDTLKLFDLDLMPAYQFFNQLANLFFFLQSANLDLGGKIKLTRQQILLESEKKFSELDKF